MNIIRHPFFGGERFVCTHCGSIVEENHYPSIHTGTSAGAIFSERPDLAKELGISFSGFNPCNCEEPEEPEEPDACAIWYESNWAFGY
jgi:hypothetical protein